MGSSLPTEASARCIALYALVKGRGEEAADDNVESMLVGHLQLNKTALKLFYEILSLLYILYRVGYLSYPGTFVYSVYSVSVLVYSTVLNVSLCYIYIIITVYRVQ